MTVTKQLHEPKILDYSRPLAAQIEQHISGLKHNRYILFDLKHFVQLQSHEKQVNFNYIVVERQMNEFVIYDNVHYREEHKCRFTYSEKVSAYVAQLLQQKTVFDYAQFRRIAESGVNFGDTVIIHRPSKTSIRGKLMSYREAFPDEVEKLSNEYRPSLFYIPFKKDGTLSKVKPRLIYGGYEIEKV